MIIVGVSPGYTRNDSGGTRKARAKTRRASTRAAALHKQGVTRNPFRETRLKTIGLWRGYNRGGSYGKEGYRSIAGKSGIRNIGGDIEAEWSIFRSRACFAKAAHKCSRAST